MSRDTRTADEVLADELATFRDDPLGYVMFAFPWSSEPSIQLVSWVEGSDAVPAEQFAPYRKRFPGCEYGPDLWACEYLDELGQAIRERKFDGRTPVAPIRMSTVSGHEIGKSTLVAWLIKFILDCYPLSKLSVTAVTDEQLRTKTWAELGKWHYMSLTRHWFDYAASRGNMSLTHADDRYSIQWRADARTSRKERSEAFAGQHAPTAVSGYIFDEASGIDDKVFEVREGGMSSGLPMVFDFGNGTRNSGAFYENCVGRRHTQYITRSIDSRTVSITNKAKIAEDADSWGEESDFFRTRWRGLFPEKGAMQFISSENAEAAGIRDVPQQNLHPVVLGVDVARFGDDASVIWPRVGRDARTYEPKVYRGLDTTQLTGRVIEYFRWFDGLQQRPAAIFVDGGGVGGGVVDQLRAAGYPVVEVQFGSSPNDPSTYRYKSDELWGNMRDAIRDGLALPSRDTEIGQRLFDDLTQREYGYTLKQQVHLETKSDMKKRGLQSPDYADALAVTFFQEVLAADPSLPHDTGNMPDHDYDPFAGL